MTPEGQVVNPSRGIPFPEYGRWGSSQGERNSRRVATYRIPGTWYDGVYHTPLGLFSTLDISTAGIVSVPKRSVVEISRRELPRRVVQYWHPLGCGAIELGKLLQGGVTYAVVYGGCKRAQVGSTCFIFFEIVVCRGFIDHSKTHV